MNTRADRNDTAEQADKAVAQDAMAMDLMAGTGLESPVAKPTDKRRGAHYPGAPRTRIASLPLPLYLVMAGIVITAAIMGTIPPSMVSGFAVTILMGGALIWVGNLIPRVRDFGLPTVLCTFVPSILVFFGVMPQNIIDVVTGFVTEQGFLDFFVIAIITGSIMGMPRALLIKAGPRFAIPLVGCLLLTFLIVGALATLTGRGFIEGILMFAAPAMGGGIGISAIPMSEMYAAQIGGTPADFMGDLMSVIVLANIVCILAAGTLNGLGKNGKQWFVGFNGEGQLLRVQGKREDLKLPAKRKVSSFISLGKGLAIAATLFVAGNLLGETIGLLHPYAWSIILVAAVKLFNVLPQDVEDSATDWGDLVNATLVPALLVGVSISYININEVIDSLSSPSFLLLIVATVLVAGVTSGVIGWFLKFNFIEISIVPGLIMADTGGSGDVSVLSAADRMHLMPFAALSTRLGGALNLFMATLLTPLLVLS